ncbi:hypothetical protein ES288_D13G112000v1 [Gossypium darwinii]|uniref:Uncharacterized protein n=1 Tax=Gossypium darwinii TaxID=34276 RepID=A0A5D1ZZG0_GOSDA|nr:hypothetical protein ES288_D13G112000v1 [Gossypium darwinii]
MKTERGRMWSPGTAVRRSVAWRRTCGRLLLRRALGLNATRVCCCVFWCWAIWAELICWA